MVMKRLSDRFSLPPALEDARNVDAKKTAILNGSPLVIKDGVWEPEQKITANYFVGKAAVAITKGSPVSVGDGGVSPATSGDVQGIAANDASAGGDVTVLRQGNITIAGLGASKILYINGTGALTEIKDDTSYFVGYTTTAGNAFLLMGGSGGGGGGGGGGTPPDIQTGNLLSGMQVRYLVPQGTTWDREPDKHVVRAELPLAVPVSSSFKLPSPYKDKPAIAEVYIKHPTTGVWTTVDVTHDTTGNTHGITVNCNGDGFVYIEVGNVFFSASTKGAVAPQPLAPVNTPCEVVVALYCQTVEVFATKVVGNTRRKYVVPVGSTWDKGNPDDIIKTSEIPLNFPGGVRRFLKIASPFGNANLRTEVWIKFVNVWRRCEDAMFDGSKDYGVVSACPGDGFIYVNIGYYPQANDTSSINLSVPPGTSGTNAGTYENYEICVIVEVADEIEIPTISAKELRDITTLGEVIELSAAIPVPITANVWGVDPAGQAKWVAPADGAIITNAQGGVGVVRVHHTSGAPYAISHCPAAQYVITAQVVKDQTYSFRRTSSATRFFFIPNQYDETKYAIYSKTGGGGPVNPEDAIRVGEVRSYNRHDTEVSSNPAFVDISKAVEVNTNDYPDFAALVGVTGMYPIPPALNVGGQTLPYIYLGRFTGTTPPEKLPADILITSDEGATGGIIFVTDDGSLDIAVSMAAVGGEDTALTSPGLLFNVGTDTGMIPIDAVLKATSDVNAEPDTPGLLIRYEKKS